MGVPGMGGVPLDVGLGVSFTVGCGVRPKIGARVSIGSTVGTIGGGVIRNIGLGVSLTGGLVGFGVLPPPSSMMGDFDGITMGGYVHFIPLLPFVDLELLPDDGIHII